MEIRMALDLEQYFLKTDINFQSRIQYSAKLPFKSEDKMKTFPALQLLNSGRNVRVCMCPFSGRYERT